MQTSYTKEFKLGFNKKIFILVILSLFLGTGLICLLSLINGYRITVETILGPIVFGLFLFAIGLIPGHILAYKKIIFIYDNEFIRLLFEGGNGGSKHKEISINLSEVSEYKECHVFRGCGSLQFIMKDNSVIKIDYSSWLDMYINARQEILRVLNSKNIKTTCVFWPNGQKS